MTSAGRFGRDDGFVLDSGWDFVALLIRAAEHLQLPGAVTRCSYPVQLPGAVTRCSYPVQLPGIVNRSDQPVQAEGSVRCAKA
jgi:hypothetical protein